MRSPVFKCHALFLLIRCLYCRGGVWSCLAPPPTVPTNQGMYQSSLHLNGRGGALGVGLSTQIRGPEQAAKVDVEDAVREWDHGEVHSLQHGPHHPVHLECGPQLFLYLCYARGGIPRLHKGCGPKEPTVDKHCPCELGKW